MNCNEIGEHLLDLASGVEVPPQTASHVRACRHCTARLEELRRTMALLDEWTAPEPSPYFLTRLQARLRDPVRLGWLDWFRKPALAGALAVLLVLGGSLYTVGVRPQPQAVVHPGAAVQDLLDLDRNQDLFANFDVLDDLDTDAGAQTLNP
jgi:hypothetical protein